MNLDYVIIGGGTAGWLTALYIQKHLPQGQVTVIASSEIGILGAGEGTTPDFMEFLNQIDVSPESILENARGTIKKGIKFTNWNGDGKDFFHPFWGQYGEEALHFDANLLAQYLQKIGLSRGIQLVDDIVTNINTDEKEVLINQLQSVYQTLLDAQTRSTGKIPYLPSTQKKIEKAINQKNTKH